MNFSLQCRQAVANLFAAKLRSFLAVLGILVGTASVVALVTSGELATREALAQFKALGTDLLAVSLFERESQTTSSPANTMTLLEWNALADTVATIQQIAPYTTMYRNLSFNGHKIEGSIIGADNSLRDVIKIKAAQGGFLSFLDNYEKFCFIGADIAKQIKAYTQDSLIGKPLWLGDAIYTIIGVAAPWQENAFFNNDVNKSVFIPIRGSNLVSANAKINNAVIRLKKGSDIEQVNKAITDYIAIHAPKLQSFQRSAKQIIKSMQSQGKIFTLLLGLIGGISLLVGGIGVMNVMLVSVVERRREIGIRMAIGARRRDIRTLFLVESIVLALFGGLLGVIVGLAISYIISYFSHWHFVLFLEPLLIGFGVSAATGVFFGFYPAYRAARLNPIETLRAD